MKSYPQEIEERAIYLSNVTLVRDAARESLQAIEDQITYDVIVERDSNGKPLYSNDALRQIAIRHRCAASQEYKDLKGSVESLEVLKTQAMLGLERVRNEFSQWKIEERLRIAGIEAES